MEHNRNGRSRRTNDVTAAVEKHDSLRTTPIIL